MQHKKLNVRKLNVKGHRVQLNLVNHMLYCTTNPDLESSKGECGAQKPAVICVRDLLIHSKLLLLYIKNDSHTIFPIILTSRE